MDNSIDNYVEIEQIYSQLISANVRTLAVCAANSNEGTSTLVCAIAERNKRAGKSTLLIDMNFFRPSLDTRFGLARSNWCVDEGLQQAVHHNVSGLTILTATTDVTGDIRQIDKLKEMIRQCRQQYDCVIIDTSPVNALNRHNLPAEQVASLVEACLMVVRTGLTTETELLSATATLKKQQAHLLGVVLNDMSCPSLACELIRQSRKIERFFPTLSQRLVKKIKLNRLINIPC